jgi:hypothetical protein
VVFRLVGEIKMNEKTIDNCVNNNAKYAKIGVNDHPYCTFEEVCNRASDQAYVPVGERLRPVCRKAYEVRRSQNHKNYKK